MQFDLTKSGLLDVRVKTKKYPDGETFRCDTTDMECIEKLLAFNNQYNGSDTFEMKTIEKDCKDVVNVVLGEGTYTKLFAKPSLDAMELCFNLMEIYQKGMTEVLTAGIKQKAEEIKATNIEVEKFMKEVEEAKKKHGISKERPTSKGKTRKK